MLDLPELTSRPAEQGALKGRHAMMSSADERAAPRAPSLGCPECGTTFVPGSRLCGNCNYEYSRLSLFSPGQYPWLAIFFSFVVPGLLAAYNWRRAGVSVSSRHWLIISALGFVTLVSVALLLPRTNLGGTLLFAYLLNLPVGYYLYRAQQPLYESFRSAGARTISPLGGVALGLGALVAYSAALLFTSALLIRIPN